MAVNQLGDGGTDGVLVGDVGTQIGFYGIGPVLQQSGTGNTSTGAAGATSTVFLNTTFTGGSAGTAYTIGDIVKALKAYGLLK